MWRIAKGERHVSSTQWPVILVRRCLWTLHSKAWRLLSVMESTTCSGSTPWFQCSSTRTVPTFVSKNLWLNVCMRVFVSGWPVMTCCQKLEQLEASKGVLWSARRYLLSQQKILFIWEKKSWQIFKRNLCLASTGLLVISFWMSRLDLLLVVVTLKS